MFRLILVLASTAMMVYLLVTSVQPMAQPDVPLAVALAVLGVYLSLAVFGVAEALMIGKELLQARRQRGPAVSSRVGQARMTSAG